MLLREPWLSQLAQQVPAMIQAADAKLDMWWKLVHELSQRRMEAAKSAKARLFEEHEEKIKKEHERAEAVAARKQQAINDVQQSSARRMAQAEEHRANPADEGSRQPG